MSATAKRPPERLQEAGGRGMHERPALIEEVHDLRPATPVRACVLPRLMRSRSRKPPPGRSSFAVENGWRPTRKSRILPTTAEAIETHRRRPTLPAFEVRRRT